MPNISPDSIIILTPPPPPPHGSAIATSSPTITLPKGMSNQQAISVLLGAILYLHGKSQNE